LVQSIFGKWREYAEKIYERRVDLHHALLNIADAIVGVLVGVGVSGRKKQVPIAAGGYARARHPYGRQVKAPYIRSERVSQPVRGEPSQRALLPSQKPATRLVAGEIAKTAKSGVNNAE
jgi:hypothetical protein